MLDVALVVLMDGLHNQTHQFRRLAAQILQIDVEGIVRTVYRASVMDKVFHLNAQKQRFFRVFHVEGVKTPAFGNDREIGFFPEIPDCGLDTDHILRPVRLSGNQVRGTEVHIAHRRREDNVCGLVISHFQTIRRNQPVKRQLACQAVVQVPLCLHPGIGILGQFQGIAGLALRFPVHFVRFLCESTHRHAQHEGKHYNYFVHTLKN